MCGYRAVGNIGKTGGSRSGRGHQPFDLPARRSICSAREVTQRPAKPERTGGFHYPRHSGYRLQSGGDLQAQPTMLSQCAIRQARHAIGGEARVRTAYHYVFPRLWVFSRLS